MYFKKLVGKIFLFFIYGLRILELEGILEINQFVFLRIDEGIEFREVSNLFLNYIIIQGGFQV